MSTAPEDVLAALPAAVAGPDTGLNRLIGDRSAGAIRLRFDPASRPAPVTWQDALRPAPLPLEPEERRLVHAFAFLLTEHKKSTPRLERMQGLYRKYPSEDLAEMLLSYSLAWDPPELSEQYGRHWLQAHPDSLGLRLNLALLALARQDAEAIPPLLDQQLFWPDFVALHPQLVHSAMNVRLFHTISCLYFAHSGRFREAAWAYAICRDTGASMQELQTLSHACERQLSVRDQWQSLIDWLTGTDVGPVISGPLSSDPVGQDDVGLDPEGLDSVGSDLDLLAAAVTADDPSGSLPHPELLAASPPDPVSPQPAAPAGPEDELG